MHVITGQAEGSTSAGHKSANKDTVKQIRATDGSYVLQAG